MLLSSMIHIFQDLFVSPEEVVDSGDKWPKKKRGSLLPWYENTVSPSG